MSPEEKVNRERWYVLQKLKTEYHRTKSDKPIEYWVHFDFVVGGVPTPKDEVSTLEKLEELGAIAILNPGGTGEYEV